MIHKAPISTFIMSRFKSGGSVRIFDKVFPMEKLSTELIQSPLILSHSLSRKKKLNTISI